jgi:hypothetical protein
VILLKRKSPRIPFVKLSAGELSLCLSLPRIPDYQDHHPHTPGVLYPPLLIKGLVLEPRQSTKLAIKRWPHPFSGRHRTARDTIPTPSPTDVKSCEDSGDSSFIAQFLVFAEIHGVELFKVIQISVPKIRIQISPQHSRIISRPLNHSTSTAFHIE